MSDDPSMKDVAFALARRLNCGESQAQALAAENVDPDEVWGEDMGGDCLPADDPDTNVIDLGWDGDTHTSYRVRRLRARAPWRVEVMQRFNDDGTLHVS